MTALDGSIIAVFILYVLAAGLRERTRASAGLDQYFLAGRELNGWQAGISMAATQFAADTPLLVAGLVAVGGVFALWRLWIYALAFLFLAFVLAACWRRAGVLTDAEFAELRYCGRGAALLRLFKAFYFGTVFNCVALAIVLLATTRIVEPFLPWHDWLPQNVSGLFERLAAPIASSLTATPATESSFGVRAGSNLFSLLLIAIVTLAYSTLGGLRSVVRTDTVQFALMMVASIIYAWLVIDAIGGLAALPARLHAVFDDVEGISASQLLAFTPSVAYDVTGLLLAVVLLQWLIQVNADGTGYLAQRVMACRDDREARRAGVVFTFAQILVRSLIWLPIALGLLLLFPTDPTLALDDHIAGREAAYVHGIAHLFPAGLKGLMLAAMIAALASTIDTHLNWGAAYWTNDIYARFVCRRLGRNPGPRSLVRVARASNVLLLALALVIMSHLESIRAAWEASLLLGSGVGVVLVLRWLWWRINAWGELAAIGISALLVPLVLALLPDDQGPARLLLVAVISSAAAIAVSLWLQPAAPKNLCAFYLKVRPPGFWGPVARLAGENPHVPRQALIDGLVATSSAALTVFGLLVGLGTWLVGGTPPAWLPERNVWIALNIAVALGVAPLWWRRGFRTTQGGESVAPSPPRMRDD